MSALDWPKLTVFVLTGIDNTEKNNKNSFRCAWERFVSLKLFSAHLVKKTQELCWNINSVRSRLRFSRRFVGDWITWTPDEYPWRQAWSPASLQLELSFLLCASPPLGVALAAHPSRWHLRCYVAQASCFPETSTTSSSIAVASGQRFEVCVWVEGRHVTTTVHLTLWPGEADGSPLCRSPWSLWTSITCCAAINTMIVDFWLFSLLFPQGWIKDCHFIVITETLVKCNQDFMKDVAVDVGMVRNTIVWSYIFD